MPKTRLSCLLRPTECGIEQIFRFGLVGALTTAVDMAVLWVLYKYLHVWYITAAAIGYSVGIVLCYVFSVRWVFPHRSVSDRRLEFAIFVFIGVLALGFTELVLYVCVDLMHVEVMFAKVVAVIVVFLFNFFARKLTIFRATPLGQGRA